MQNCAKYGIIFLLLFLSTSTIIFGQVLNGGNSHKNITAQFVREDIKIKPQTPFFNVLKISNGSDRQRFVNLTYEIPVGWSLISDQDNRINLPPHDTVSVPLRVSPNQQVKGEIGYSVIASLTNRSGEPITTSYCFIKVPRQSDLRFRPLTRVTYINQQKRTGSFSFRLINEGNVDEVVYLNFTSTPDVDMKKEVNNSFSSNLVVPARSDTTLSYQVTIDKKQAQKSLYRINLTGHTEYSRFNSSFWFKNLVSRFQYEKPSSEVPLIVELNMENLFSDQGSYFSGSAQGNLLFSNDREIKYYFLKMPDRSPRTNFLNTSRIFLNYNTPTFNAKLGNRIPFRLRTGYGKGAALQYKQFNNFKIQGKYTRNEFLPINNYGLSTDFNLFKSRLQTHTNLEYSHNLRTDEQIMLGLFSNRLVIQDEHNIETEFGMSSKARNLFNGNQLGLHYRLKYNGEIDDLRFRFRNRYNSDDYYGSFYGKNDIKFNANYDYKKGYRFNLNFFNSRYQPSSVYRNESSSDYRLQRNINFRTSKLLNNSLSLFGQGGYEYFNSNAFYTNNQTRHPFITNSGYLEIGGRLNLNTYDRISTSFKGGYTFATQYEVNQTNESQKRALANREQSFNGIFNLNYYSPNWGVFFRYNYGPYNGNQYYTYLYSGNFNQLLRLMPYYRDYIYKDIIQFDSRMNYMYSINRQTHRLNWGNEVKFHLNYGLMLRLIANFTLQSTMGESQEMRIQEKQQYTYSNSYFELRLQKRFDWNQPRMKYYNLNVNLFKDLNGNLKRDGNEPGVKNVLVNIERVDATELDTFDVSYEQSGNLVNNRLLSGMQGRIRYENMPQGVYRLRLKNVGKEGGKFTADQQEVLINMDKDRTVDIPYLERNKIYGRVILNRSKLSNLGPLDKSNIKVTAVDSKGRKTSTLTDKKGKFVIYAPSVDKYDVYINNIFKEHFDLRKNHYKVQLNGYKQFEVNFIFDEKRREINFTPSMSETDVEVKSVKRTNLTGTIKDENTLQPVRATLEVVDNKTGTTVETTHSDPETGRFSMSFMTGNNYSLIVSAQGYWLYTEKLDLDQMLTIQDVEKEILLKNIMIGSRLDLENLQFEPGSAEIPNDAYPELDRLIEQLKDNPNVRIQIAGHADALEQLDHPNISEDRAKAVAKYIMKNGFSNIEYVGYNDKKPVAPNDSPENRAKNRRVEITVVDK